MIAHIETERGIAKTRLTPSATHGTLPVLEVRNVRKEFPGTLALDNVSLTVRPGEVHAVLGENGAGKTTLIKCICGAYVPTAGEILVDGVVRSFATPKDASAAGIAVVHQHLSLVPSLTVTENLWLGERLPTWMGLVDWRNAHAQARTLLGQLGLDIDPTAEIGYLRPDERAMVSIAKAISRNARIIILDEPTATLVPQEAERLFGQMKNLAARGHSFLYISHRLAEIFEIADRVTVLRDGRNAGEFDHETLDRKRIVEAIVGNAVELVECKSSSHVLPDVLMAVENLAGETVRDASFVLHAGEILGIAGLPGSGAAEALDLLFGRTRRKSGQILIDGRERTLHHPADAITAGLAFVPQDRHAEAMFPMESVRVNITMPALSRYVLVPVLRLISRRAEAQAALNVVERMRVRPAAIEVAIDELSGGNQQKAVLGRWLSTGARVFLLNSATAAVDVGAKAEIYRLIEDLAAQGNGIIFCSTEVEEYPRVCDRALVFVAGRIVGEVSGNRLSERSIMTLYAGEPLSND